MKITGVLNTSYFLIELKTKIQLEMNLFKTYIHYIANIPTIVEAIIKINIENTTILLAKFLTFFFFFCSLLFFIKFNLPIIKILLSFNHSKYQLF